MTSGQTSDPLGSPSSIRPGVGSITNIAVADEPDRKFSDGDGGLIPVNSEVQRDTLNDLSFPVDHEELETSPPTGRLGRTGNDIFAAPMFSREEKGKPSVLALYRVTEDEERKKIAPIDVLMFHLWLLWGKTGIQPPGTYSSSFYSLE